MPHTVTSVLGLHTVCQCLFYVTLGIIGLNEASLNVLSDGAHKSSFDISDLENLFISYLIFMKSASKCMVCQDLASQIHSSPTLLFSLRLLIVLPKPEYCTDHNNPKDWDTLSVYRMCPKIWNSPFYCLVMCIKYCCMYGKQCRPWSDAAFCSVWSGSTMFAKAYLSQYLGFLWYTEYTLDMPE